MQVQHSGASVVTLDCLFDVFCHGDRDIFREVLRHPLGTVRGDGNNYFFLVFRVQRIV
ncbi:hypothetical protein D9M71_527020 [compost metagenome]